MATVGWSTKQNYSKLDEYEITEKIRRLVNRPILCEDCDLCIWNNYGPERKEIGIGCGRGVLVKMMDRLIKNYKNTEGKGGSL